MSKRKSAPTNWHHKILRFCRNIFFAEIELSRRDDLFSIGYVLIYFLKGVLPWQGLQGNTSEEKYQMIYEKKVNTTNEELCTDLPGKKTICYIEMQIN